MDNRNNNMIGEEQRRRGLESPSQIHQYVKVTAVSGIFISMAGIVLILAFMIWAFLGEVTDKVYYKGVIFQDNNLYDISIPQAGVIRQMKVGKGDNVKKGQPVALVSIGSSYSNVSSYASGRVVQTKVEGEEFQPMDPIVSLVGNGEKTFIAYTNNSTLRDLVVGMKTQIWPADEDRDDIGYFTGTIVEIDPYPIQPQEMKQRFRNPGLVNGVFPDKGAVYEVTISIDYDKNGELCWSFGKPEGVDVGVGTLCNVMTETKRRSIIEYVFEKVRIGVNSLR